MAKQKFDDTDRPLPRPDVVRNRPTHPVDPSRIEVGDIMCTYSYGTPDQYGKVIEIGPDVTFLRFENLVDDPDPPKLVLDDEFVIPGRDRIAAMASADYHAADVKVNLTDMGRLLGTSEGTPFSVFFIKKDGQERILRGYLVGPGHFGRSLCRDLEIPRRKIRREKEDETDKEREEREEAEKRKRLRLVDHRSLIWLITEGVRYLLT